jgi:hypothetical protein
VDNQPPALLPGDEPTVDFLPPRVEPTTAEQVLTVSTSEIHTLGRCKRLYWYEYVDGRRPALQKHDMVWGGALHRGLEGWFSAMKEGASLGFSLEKALVMALTPGVDDKGRPYTPPADPYARAALRAILRAYVEYWWTDPTTYTIEAVELAFRLPVRTARGRLVKGKACGVCGGLAQTSGVFSECNGCGGSGRLRPMREGKIDLVVRERVTTECEGCPPGVEHNAGKLWLVEHKSTTWDPTHDGYYTGIERDLQTALYFDAARELGLDPAGVLYDVIRRPAYDEPKPPPKLNKDGSPRKAKTVECEACSEGLGKEDGAGGYLPCEVCHGTGRVSAEPMYSNPRFGESPAAYEERVYRLATNPDTRDAWFGRRYLPITEEQVREARATTHAAVDEVRWMARTGHYPMVNNRYVCAPPRKGGNGGVCPWLDVCDGRVAEGSGDYERLYPLKVRKDGGE